jgi:hypothetical protein
LREALRLIARGHGEVGAEWRARWKAATKTGSPLFEGPTTDWNINQVALSYWTNFYDNVYEHPERPDQNIINSDDLLDKWVEDESKKMEDRAKSNSRNYNKRPTGTYDKEEVIYFDEEEWEEVVENEEDQDTEIDVFD